MSDLISRQDAIDSIQPWIDGYGYNESERNIMRCCIQAIKDVPSAQKTGKWIKTYRNGFGNMIGYCNECGRKAEVDNYCPNCGAKMMEE